MNPTRVARICLWGGLAAVLAGILLFGGGCVATNYNSDPYTAAPPGAEPAVLAGIVFLLIGILMILCGAVIKALGLPEKEHTRTRHIDT